MSRGRHQERFRFDQKDWQENEPSPRSNTRSVASRFALSEFYIHSGFVLFPSLSLPVLCSSIWSWFRCCHHHCGHHLSAAGFHEDFAVDLCGCSLDAPTPKSSFLIYVNTFIIINVTINGCWSLWLTTTISTKWPCHSPLSLLRRVQSKRSRITSSSQLLHIGCHLHPSVEIWNTVLEQDCAARMSHKSNVNMHELLYQDFSWEPFKICLIRAPSVDFVILKQVDCIRFSTNQN